MTVKRSKWLYAMAMFVVALVAVALLGVTAELAVRVRNYLKYGELFWGIEETYTIDAASGLRIPIPNGHFGHILINSMGFRSPEILVPKPADTARIAFLGASTTYCAEVSSNQKAWPDEVWHGLERALPNVRIDYVNAGVPGYGVAASQKNLERRVAKLAPDVIVYYEATNDLKGNSFALAEAAGIAQERAEKQFMWPAKYSLLWYLAELNLRIVSQKNPATNSAKLTIHGDELTAPFRRDLTSFVQAAHRVTDVVVLVTFSSRLRRDQPPEEQAKAVQTDIFYMPYMSIDSLLDAYEAYNVVIREVAQAEGAILIDGNESIPGDAAHFADSVHFTDLGSATMAERVTKGLLASSVVRARLQKPSLASTVSTGS
jgi:lysophospholipase L1-like esterase